MKRMKRPVVTFAVVVALGSAAGLVGVWLDLGSWGLFFAGSAAMFLATLTDREAFYGPSSDSRR